jgi:hypothetical protein
MPEWIHARAERLLEKNPSMPKGEAFAIATQQSHALGKSPKGYGTTKGREMAQRKFSTPDDDQKTAQGRSFDVLALAAMREEYQKMADSTFTTSQYAGPMGTVPFQQASQLPAFKTPGLRAAIEKPQQKIAELSDEEVREMGAGAKEAAALRSGKLPDVFKKEKGVIGRAKQLLSGERSLALKTYKERYENQAGRLARKAEAHARHNSPPEYVGAIKRDAEITGRAAGRIGKIHRAEAAKSTAARTGVVGAAAGAGFGAGRAGSGDEKEAAALTPAGRLVSSQRKGTGMGASVTGPSIAEVAKPPRMGHAIPGALKNQI